MKKNISRNPFTKKEYEIPQNVDDKERIDKFLFENVGKKVIVVQGLGFVGAVMSIVCANAHGEEYAVIGVDLLNEHSFWKIESINEGVFPIVASDPKIHQYFEKSKKKNNFLATFDPRAFGHADVIVVDINLDVKKDVGANGELLDFDVDLTGFKRAIESIGFYCKPTVHIIVETTVPPGTCIKVVQPIIKSQLTKRGFPDSEFMLGHSYERVMPGPNYIDSIENFYRVYSGIDENSAVATENFLRTIIKTDKYPLSRLGNTTSTEMSKVLENSYRAANIAFIEEWSRFAEKADVNLYEVIKAIRLRPTHKNIMYPGLGVGGYCLTKDPLLASWSKKTLFNDDHGLSQSEKAVEKNDKMPYDTFSFISRSVKLKSWNNLKVLFLGVSYRSNVGDTRFTPVQALYDIIASKGAIINLHDPYVSFWEEKRMEISVIKEDLLAKEYDVVIFTTNHEEYSDSKILQHALLQMENVIIVDTVGALSDNDIDVLKTNCDLYIVGRGDLN